MQANSAYLKRPRQQKNRFTCGRRHDTIYDMKKCRITVMRIVRHADLMEEYENPMEHACGMREGMTFISEGARMPDGMCESAWESIKQFVLALACGGEDIYDGWMKNRRSAMISCNDGFRPVSFYIEALDE